MRAWIGLVVAVAACGARPPAGALGARWGEALEPLVRRFGARCDGARDGAYELCAAEPVRVFDRPARVVLVGRAGKLAAVHVRFDGAACHHRQLQAAIAEEFDVKYTPGESASPYHVFAAGEVVHFDRCTLTVGDGEFGRDFESRLIGEGLRGLGNALVPH